MGWALVALSDPDGGAAGSDAVSSFLGDDDSEAQRKSAFLVAGLAGLGRLPNSPRDNFGSEL